MCIDFPVSLVMIPFACVVRNPLLATRDDEPEGLAERSAERWAENCGMCMCGGLSVIGCFGCCCGCCCEAEHGDL